MEQTPLLRWFRRRLVLLALATLAALAVIISGFVTDSFVLRWVGVGLLGIPLLYGIGAADVTRQIDRALNDMVSAFKDEAERSERQLPATTHLLTRLEQQTSQYPTLIQFVIALSAIAAVLVAVVAR